MTFDDVGRYTKQQEKDIKLYGQYDFNFAKIIFCIEKTR